MTPGYNTPSHAYTIVLWWTKWLKGELCHNLEVIRVNWATFKHQHHCQKLAQHARRVNDDVLGVN